MTIASSLHLVLLHDCIGCEGYGLDYQRLREEIRKYPAHGEISQSGWYIVSADTDVEILAHLSHFLPRLPSDHSPDAKALRIAVGNIVIGSTKDVEPISDPLAQRLFVVRVYYPGNKDLADPHMKALYDKLVVSPKPSRVVAA